MDSSPDLSLKLRRGSSDSRDNYYMDFAQGIDSDIEEVDNTLLQDTAASPTVNIVDNTGIPPPSSFLVGVQSQMLSTLQEHDDVPLSPTSPTGDILDIVPPPSPQLLKMLNLRDSSPSPPIETEDEDDEKTSYPIISRQGESKLEQQIPDIESKNGNLAPPNDVHTPSSQCLYSDEEQLPQPMQGSTPSISASPSPSPPPTPPSYHPPKTVSPSNGDTYHMPSPPLPLESDQFEPESLENKINEDLPINISPISYKYDLPEHMEPIDPQACDEKLEDIEISTVSNLVEDALQSIKEEDLKSLTLSVGKEYSDTFIVQSSVQDEQNNNNDELQLDVKEKLEDHSDVEITRVQSKTSLVDIKPCDLDETYAEQSSISEEELLEVAQQEEIVIQEKETYEGIEKEHGSATSQMTGISEIITTNEDLELQDKVIERVSSGTDSDGGISTPNASRRGSQETSRSVKLSSREDSIVDVSLVSAPAPVIAEREREEEVVRSPSTSVKSEISLQGSIKSQLSVKLSDSLSQQSLPHKISTKPQSPQEGDKPPSMPSPPIIRRSSNGSDRISLMHSPPKICSPPKVHSPPLINSADVVNAETSINEKEKSNIMDEVPIPSSLVEVTESLEVIDDVSTEYKVEQPQSVQQCTVTTTQTFSVPRQINSHHHYHLPHQFQHPHHQNHHTHSHGALPVSTPTVPDTYVSSNLINESRKAYTATSSGAIPSAAHMATRSDITTSEGILTSKLTATHMKESHLEHHVTINESTLIGALGDNGSGEPNGSGSPSPGSILQGQLNGDECHTNNLNLMHHPSQLNNLPVLPVIKRTHRPSFIYPPMPRIRAGDTLATLLSALYGKLLVVMGVAFPMAEVISTYIPPSFYEVYYLYLYIGSMIFLMFMYATLLWGHPKIPANIVSPTKSSAKTRSTSVSDSMDESDVENCSAHKRHLSTTITLARRPSLLSPLGRQHHYGSFYLRMGAVAFGIGSMIYSGLEFGQYFELNRDTKCHNVLLALTPATRMAFIFIQMYFIFLNNEQIKVYRYKIIARFGLMHMIGTNLAVWLNVLIQETKHEILTFYNPENRTLRISHRIPGHSRAHSVLASADSTIGSYAHVRVTRGLKGPYQIFECRRTNILGTLVQDASPFLFPCTIEYSLICAAILYVMWKGITSPQTTISTRPDMISSPIKRSPHHYSVDCARAHRGLFVGILVLVLTIISLILFFVLISRPDFVALAVLEVTTCELFIYGTATIATLLGMIQIRHLQYDAFRSFSLDDILLVGAQTGSFLYNIFTVIAGHFSVRSDDWLVPINALASIVQTACQTMFILDAGRRQAVMPEHIRKKPGREIVTFMLVVNLALWAISTLEKSRAESHPIQLNFYGLWAWTIITHVSMPLAIFYRFHSTVCLCEIWKRAYKLKPTYM